MAIQGSYFYNSRWGEVKKTAARTLAVAMNVTPPGHSTPLWQQLLDGCPASELIPLIAQEQGKVLAGFNCSSNWWLAISGDVCSFMGLAYSTQSTQLARMLGKIRKQLIPLHRKDQTGWRDIFRVLVSQALNFLADIRPVLDAENLSAWLGHPITVNRMVDLGKVDKAMGMVMEVAQRHPCEQSWIFEISPDVGIDAVSQYTLLNRLQQESGLMKCAVRNLASSTPGFFLTRQGTVPKKAANHLFNPDCSASRLRVEQMVEMLFENREVELVCCDLRPAAKGLYADSTIADDRPDEPECISSRQVLNSTLDLALDAKVSGTQPFPIPGMPGANETSDFPGKYLVAEEFRDALLSFFINDVDDRVLVFLIHEILGDTDWGHLSELVNNARSKAQHRLTRQSVEQAFGTSWYRLQMLARQLESLVRDSSTFIATQPGIEERKQYVRLLRAQKDDYLARQAKVFPKGVSVGKL